MRRRVQKVSLLTLLTLIVALFLPSMTFAQETATTVTGLRNSNTSLILADFLVATEKVKVVKVNMYLKEGKKTASIEPNGSGSTLCGAAEFYIFNDTGGWARFAYKATSYYGGWSSTYYYTDWFNQRTSDQEVTAGPGTVNGTTVWSQVVRKYTTSGEVGGYTTISGYAAGLSSQCVSVTLYDHDYITG